MAVISKLNLNNKDITKYNNKPITNISFNNTDYHFASKAEVLDGICENSVNEPLIDLNIVGNSIQSDYTIIDYIKCTGVQVIDTGIKPDASTSIDITYSASDKTNSQYILGSRLTSSDLTIHYAANGNGGDAYWDVRFNGVEYDLKETNRTNDKINTKINLLDGNGSWEFTNLVTGENYITPLTGVEISVNAPNLFIFGYNTTNRHSGLSIYNCKIYQNNILVRDFTPCIRTSDLKPCMYDNVTNEFYTNAYSNDNFEASDGLQEKVVEYTGNKPTNMYFGDVVRSTCNTSGVITLNSSSNTYAGINSKLQVKGNTAYKITSEGFTTEETRNIYYGEWDTEGNFLGRNSTSNGIITTQPNTTELFLYYYNSGSMQLDGNERICVTLNGYELPMVIYNESGKNLIDDRWFAERKPGYYSYDDGITVLQRAEYAKIGVPLDVGNYVISCVKNRSKCQCVITVNGTNYYGSQSSGYMRFEVKNAPQTAWFSFICSEYPIDIGHIQLEKGSSVTKYEPYIEHLVLDNNLILNEPLRKVGEITDYIDYKNNKIIRNVGCKVFDGTEGTWERYNTTSNTYKYNGTLNVKKGDSQTNTFMDYFNLTDKTGTANFIVGEYRFVGNSGNIDGEGVYMCTGHPSIEEFTTWLSEHKPYILYPLATPIEEDIVINNIETFDYKTTIEVNTDVPPSEIKATYWKQI